VLVRATGRRSFLIYFSPVVSTRPVVRRLTAKMVVYFYLPIPLEPRLTNAIFFLLRPFLSPFRDDLKMLAVKEVFAVRLFSFHFAPCAAMFFRFFPLSFRCQFSSFRTPSLLFSPVAVVPFNPVFGEANPSLFRLQRCVTPGRDW